MIQIPPYNLSSKLICLVSDCSQQAALATTHMPSQNRSQKPVAHVKENLAAAQYLKDIIDGETSKEYTLVELSLTSLSASYYRCLARVHQP
jgi:hypothetical protein